MACKGIDEQVVRQDKELEELEKKFVCVRLIKMQGVDLRLFQFDFDQTWCVFLLNADGTIYGRYGTRAAGGHGPNAKDATSHISVASLKKAMERSLDLHKGYPANKDQLAAKRGPEPAYKLAEEIPGLQDRAKGTATRQNCIHCHMVASNAKRALWEQKKLTPADVWTHPLPETIGLKIDVDDGLKVKSVAADSPAAKAGIEAGDALIKLNGQPLISQADIQWVLHHAPAETKLPVTFKRGDQTVEKTLALSGAWKESGDLSWRASTGMGLRYGLFSSAMSAADKKNRGIAADALALQVRIQGVAQGQEKLNRAGVRANDIIVAVDGKSEAMTESQFLAYVRLNHPPGDKVKLTLLRGNERMELEVPAW